jgi:hypothetical protein
MRQTLSRGPVKIATRRNLSRYVSALTVLLGSQCAGHANGRDRKFFQSVAIFQTCLITGAIASIARVIRRHAALLSG